MVEIRTMVAALMNFIGCVNSLPLAKYVKFLTMPFDIKVLSISFSTGRVLMQLWRHLSLENLTNFDSFFSYFLLTLSNKIYLLFVYIVIYSCHLHHIKIWHFKGLR